MTEQTVEAEKAFKEAVFEAVGNIWEDNWNPDAHVELTLSISECRAICNRLGPPKPKLTEAEVREKAIRFAWDNSPAMNTCNLLVAFARELGVIGDGGGESE